MKKPHFFKSYTRVIRSLMSRHDEPEAMSLAVGGDFEVVGLLEYFLLLQCGLQRNQTVIDVGCGSGRLAFQLREYLKGLYIGIDISPELLEYARKISDRPDWKFYPAPGVTIPEADNSADFICFFSVFTHLHHEESFKYLMDARRVMKPGGRIIFSFLEYSLPCHWDLFMNSLKDTSPDKVMNQFISRDAIQIWADFLELQILEMHDGDKPHIHLDRVIRWEDGNEMRDRGYLGQSVCILTKK